MTTMTAEPASVGASPPRPARLRLTAQEVRRYTADGALAPVPALRAAEAAAVRASVERVERERGGRLSAFANTKPHLLLPFLSDIVHDPRIVDCVADLLGPDIVCLGSSLIDKPPASSRHVAWHQDATYWGLAAPEAVTAWIALTPSTPQSGCVRVIPGSHAAGLDHEDSGDPDNILGAGERLAEPPDTARAVDLILAPGEMSLHHPLVVHGSLPNRSAQRRLGFAARYVSAHVRQEGGTVTLVRGRAPEDVRLEEPPRGEFEEAAVARHVDIVRRGARIVLGAKARHAARSTGPAA